MNKLFSFLFLFALASACSAQTSEKPYIKLGQDVYSFYAFEEGTRDSIFASDNVNVIVHYTDTLKVITIQSFYVETITVNGKSIDRVTTDETIITRKKNSKK